VDENGIPFSQTPLTPLRVRPIETYLERRYVLTPRAAVGEHQSLQAILRLAARRGETFQQGLLMIEPLRRRTRKRTGLAPDHIDYLADTAPDHQQRLLRLAKTLGNRITELLLAEDAWLVDGAIVIPAWACKERREKTLHLLPEEQVIIREQRLVRSPGTVLGRAGTPLLFPRKHGTAWKLHAYWTKVVIPVRRKAAERWRAEHELPAGADTPFEWTVVDDHGRPIIEPDGSLRIGGFAPHDLRRSAADLLRRLGIEDRLIAARFGHADQGQLVAATYAADTRREELAAELQAIAAEGGTTARLERLAEARR
jgi:integrase